MFAFFCSTVPCKLFCFFFLQGHNKNILALASSEDGSALYTGSFDARICILVLKL